jgi:hypothetical protein
MVIPDQKVGMHGSQRAAGPAHPRSERHRGEAGDDVTDIAGMESQEEVEIRRPLSKEATCEMNQWIITHAVRPYLTKQEVHYFMTKHGLTRRQVKIAFNNRRQQIIAQIRTQTLEIIKLQRQHQFLNQCIARAMTIPQCWQLFVSPQ